MKRAFTLIELIFVIVIIGLLAAVAVPKFLNLKQNALGSNLVTVISDLNSSGGASTYLNETELNGVASADLNITNLYKFQGKDWTISSDEKTATYRSGHSDLNATLTYSDGEVNATIYCDTTTNAGKAAENYLKNHGLDCSPSGESYTIDLETQQ